MPMELLPATPLAARVLARDVREMDKKEWELGTGGPFLVQLREGLKIPGSWNMALWDGGQCLAIFGVHPVVGVPMSLGQAWFVGTNAIMARPHETHRFWNQCITEMHERFGTLIAHAWDQNHVHHIWMRRMGFEQLGSVFHEGVDAQFLTFIRNR